MEEKIVQLFPGFPANTIAVRFEFFTAGTMKNAVFRDVMLCGSCKNRHFRGTSVLTRAT
jgi:hypothetical protein